MSAKSQATLTGKDFKAASQELLDFIASSPTQFHAVLTSAEMLEAAGFSYLDEKDAWAIEPDHGYYTTRNGSSIIAFSIGSAASDPDSLSFNLTASHSDSPSFKLKDVPDLQGPEGYLRLNVEAYGGMIDNTWFDRPLSVAGRVFVQEKGGVKSVPVAIDRNILIIPNVAIHFNRNVNEGVALNRQVDLCPLVSAGELAGKSFIELVAKEAGISPKAIVSHDLFLWNRTPACVWGLADEFISAPRIDDLQCAFASLKAFLSASNKKRVNVWACFDNEEVGSNTKQGAMSTFLADTLHRLVSCLGHTSETYRRALAKSLLLSCDNAHAIHPNHPELTDEVNHPILNGGMVIKEAANQKYTTDAASRALFKEACTKAGVPLQRFANRSDSAGGSTLGNLSNIQVSLDAIDIGLPQLAMHSSYETAGVKDTAYAIEAIKAFYNSAICK